jgi:hypothetical protein
MLSIYLGILSIGLSFTSIGAQNTIVLNTPRQSSGLSLGIANLLRIVGSSTDPGTLSTPQTFGDLIFESIAKIVRNNWRLMSSKSMIEAYCDCGHLSIFHLMWKMNDDSEHMKCYGRD